MGNGRFMVALDKTMRVRDFCYPRVGLETPASGHLFRFGVQAGKVFSWVGGDWEISIKYLPVAWLTV